MPVAPIDIYNQALARIGVFNGFLVVPEEQTKEANICGLFYSACVDYVLRDHPWNFAKRRALLNDLGTPPTGWAYRYALPGDCVSVRYIVNPFVRNPREDQAVPFEVASSGTQRVIHTDLAEAELVYTASITDLSQWDPILTSALAYRLAAEIAMPLGKTADVAQAAMQGYYRDSSNAAARGLAEGKADTEPQCEALAIRGGTAQWFPDGRVIL